jgi:hypothetical protein
MSEQTISAFYREYNLATARSQQSSRSARIPAGHQRAALEKLHSWFSSTSDKACAKPDRSNSEYLDPR